MVIGLNNKCVSNHSVLIADRGGSRQLWKLTDLAKVEWERKLDDTSSAKVSISGKSCQTQASILRRIEPRRHEMVIYRGDDRVWEGPIIDGKWARDGVSLNALDVTEYLNNTALSKDWPNSDGGGPEHMTERVRQIIEYELNTDIEYDTNQGILARVAWENLDPPANVLPYVEIIQSDGILTRSETEAFQMTVGEHLGNLARGGLNFTAIGRKLLVWDGGKLIGQTRKLTDKDFYGDLDVYASGRDLRIIAHLTAQANDADAEEPGTGEAETAVGHAGQTDSYYGSWETVVSMTSEEGNDTPDQTELNSQAQRQLTGRNPVPTEIVVPSNAGLKLSESLRINQLVPGVVMPVMATLNLREVSQDQMLDSMKVTETGDGENVAVTLVPAGNLGAL